MEHKEKKYVVLPGQEEGGQIEFDMEKMKDGNVQSTAKNEYEQMQFQVNSFYEEVSRERYSGNKSQGNMPNMHENHSVINQKRYDQAQQFYKQAFEQSYQDGYYQGYQECYGKVYEQAYQQAYKQAFDQAYTQKTSTVHNILSNDVNPSDKPQVEEKVQELQQCDVVADEKMEIPVRVPVESPEQNLEENPAESPVNEELSTEDNIVIPKLKNNEIKDERNKVETKIVAESTQDDNEIKEVMGIKQVEELHPERVDLHELAREEYRQDVRLYAGKWNKSYVRKFSKMNETKQFLNWNFPAFLFGPFWFAYRKMPLVSIGLLITHVLILSADNGLLLMGGAMILTGALSDKIYKAHMDRLLDAKALMGDESQATHLKLRGGVSVLYPLTLIVLTLGLGIYITEVLIYKSDFLKGIYDNLVNLYHTYL